MLRGDKRYDLKYQFHKDDSYKMTINTVTDFAMSAAPGAKPNKTMMDLQLITQVTEARPNGCQLGLIAALRSLMIDGKNVTSESAEEFSKLKVSAVATDKGQIVSGTITAEGAARAEEFLAQAIAPLPKKPVARKDDWPAEGFLSPADCSALLPAMFRGVDMRVSGRFVLADVTVKAKKKCAQIVGHFTIRADGQKTLGGQPTNLATKADYEYVAYFAIEEGYMTEIETTGYITSSIKSGGGASNVSAKVQIWSQTRKTSGE